MVSKIAQGGEGKCTSIIIIVVIYDEGITFTALGAFIETKSPVVQRWRTFSFINHGHYVDADKHAKKYQKNKYRKNWFRGIIELNCELLFYN